jgi:hypothetical protein
MVLTGHRLRVTAIDFSLSLLFSPFWCLLPKGEKIREMRGVNFFRRYGGLGGSAAACRVSV